MKTRIITAVVGLAVLAVVLAFFDTILFDLVLAAICLLAIHEVFTAMGFGKKQWYLYAAAVPFTMLLMLSSSGAARAALLAVGFLTVLFYNVVLITHDKTLDFGKLSGFIYFSGVILFCFYSLIHLKRCLPMDMYGYDAIYFILLILCFAWGGDTCAYFAGRAFGKHKLAPVVSPNKTVEGAIGGVIGSVVIGLLATIIYSALPAVRQPDGGCHRAALYHHCRHGRRGVGAGHFGRSLRLCRQASGGYQRLRHHFPRPRRYFGPV